MLYIDDLIGIARAAEQAPDSQLGRIEWFRHALRERGVDLDEDLWRSCCAMMRTVIGPESGDYLYGFPYPDLVGAAMALAGTTDDGVTLADEIAQQRREDYPRGACVPKCPSPGRCDHVTAIGAAYERAACGAQCLSSVLFWARRNG